MPSQIFISYRRGDATPYARLIQERLGGRFGYENVFMDMDAIPPGVDFARHIEEAVASCAVLIAVIGEDWYAATDTGQRRLDDPDDFVRIEVAAGLERDVRVIPVLVEGAQMPSAAELPEPLTGLARRQALRMSDERWRQDADVLVQAIEKVVVGRDMGAAISEAAEEVGPEAQPVAVSPADDAAPPPEQDAAPRMRRLLDQVRRRASPRWLAIGLIPLAAVVAIVLVAGGGEGPGLAQRLAAFPQAIEPLSSVLPRFERAVNSGGCVQVAQYLNSWERPSEVGPGDRPSPAECRQIREDYAPLRGLRIGRFQEFRMAAVVDATIGRETLGMVWLVDVDRRWAHAENLDRFGPAAAQAQTSSSNPGLYDDRARKFIAAIRARDCRTAHFLLSPNSPYLAASEAETCKQVNSASGNPDSFLGGVVADRSAPLLPLGKTKGRAFYGIKLKRPGFWTLLVVDISTSTKPAEAEGHAPQAGVFDWYGAGGGS